MLNLTEERSTFVSHLECGLEGDRYAVYFDVFNFQPVLPGQHLHFFFDTVPPEQAGLPGGGPWKIYPAVNGGTADSPYTGYGVSERPAAAGQIHTDFEHGFIRAETIHFEDYQTHGSEHAARDAGVMRSEGKDYVVQDGDVIHFRFNV